MSLHCLLLTTDTPHHRYVAGRIRPTVQLSVILERLQRVPSLDRFERLQEAFEVRAFFKKDDDPGFRNVKEFESVNEPACLRWVQELAPDLLITFGTRRVVPKLFQSTPLSINIHRGILPDYRGLDSDLWAVYNGEIDNLGTTLHRLDDQLDTGPILDRRRLLIQPGTRLHHLRYHTTVLAAQMLEDLIRRIEAGRAIPETPQDLFRGRYYSSIPPLQRRLAGRKLKRELTEVAG